MSKSLLFAVPGIRTFKIKLADGKEHKFHMHAKTPAEIAVFYGGERRQVESKEGDEAQDRFRAEFIASALCDATGAALMTSDEALRIPVPLKVQLCLEITSESNRAGDVGKA